MANKKFSEFVLKTSTSDVSHIVGYNGAENVQITPANFVTTGGTGVFLPLAGGTMVGNTTHNDNVKSIYGTANDGLEIFHDGGNSFIRDLGTGNLLIDSNGAQLKLRVNTTEAALVANSNSSVELYYNNVKKFETTSTGISVTGDGTFTGNVNVGSTNLVKLVDQSYGGELGLYYGTTNHWKQYHFSDNSLRFNYNGSGGDELIIDTSGNATFAGFVDITTGIIQLAQNKIDGSSDNLKISADFGNVSGSSTIEFLVDGSEKMRLDSSGQLGIGLSTNINAPLTLQSNGSGSAINLVGRNNGTFDESIIGFYDNDGTTRKGYILNSGGNMFFASGGSNENMILDSSGQLGVGTSTPDALLHISQASSNAQLIVERTGSATGKYQVYTNDNNLYFNNLASSSNPLVILDNGRIGMGNLAPDVNLEISGSGTSYPKLKLSNPSQTGRYLQIGMIDAVESTIEVNGGSTFLTFKTEATEKMRLTSSGDLLIGATSTSSATGSWFESAGAGRMILNLANSSTGGLTVQRFINGNGTVGSISTSGTATSFNTSSDYRLKEDLQDFEGLDLVSKIPVYDYKWKSDKSRSYGVMAHELEEVLPQAVSGEKDAEEMQSVDYSKIVPLLVKSIQELSAKLEALECQCEKK